MTETRENYAFNEAMGKMDEVDNMMREIRVIEDWNMDILLTINGLRSLINKMKTDPMRATESDKIISKEVELMGWTSILKENDQRIDEYNERIQAM